MSYKDFINNFSLTPVGQWLVKTFAARVDPTIYKFTGGRFTMSGPLTIPQLTLTTVGRKSGKERTVQLGYTEDGDDVLVVASNYGGTKHPAWSHNLDANPDAKISARCRQQEKRRCVPLDGFGKGHPLAKNRRYHSADEVVREEDGAEYQGVPCRPRDRP